MKPVIKQVVTSEQKEMRRTGQVMEKEDGRSLEELILSRKQ